MPNWRAFSDKPFLGHWDLPDGGQDVVVTIERVSGGEVVGEGGKKSKKPMIHFVGVPKPLIAGATICKTIERMYGTGDVSQWAGKRVALFRTTTSAQGGEIVECIRVRPRVPEAEAKKPAEEQATN